jgi:capsular polysaccharide biosynthesis protein
MLSPRVVSITANGVSASQAATVADAVAVSYIRFLNLSQTSNDVMRAQMLNRASTFPMRTAPLAVGAVIGALGVLAGFLLEVILALALGGNRGRGITGLAYTSTS